MIVFLQAAAYAEKGYALPWGKDSDLAYTKSYVMPPPRQGLAGQIAESLILLHQNFISPASGPRSNFRPTSSRYMLLSIRRYGFLKGFVMGCDRLLRENKDPWVYRTIVIDRTKYKWDPTFERIERHYHPLSVDPQSSYQ